MKPQFDQKLLSSFYLWFDDRVVRYGEAVESGIKQNFYYSANSVDIGDNKVAYYSPDRQFVSNGYNVPSGAYLNDVFILQDPTSTEGLLIDHNQGRIILNSSMGNNLTVRGEFSRKTLNTYIKNECEEERLLNTYLLLAEQDDQTFLESINGFSALNYTVPAAFVSYNSSVNKPFALGGLQDTRSNIRAVVVANDNYTLDSTLSLFRDSTESIFPIIDYAEFPYGEYFHIKNPPFVYEDLCKSKMAIGAPYGFIEKINVSKLYDTSSSALNLPRNMRIGFIDFLISTPRLARAELGKPSFDSQKPEPAPADEATITIEGPYNNAFIPLPVKFWPENKGFSSFEIRNNPLFPSSKLSELFNDSLNQKPDEYTQSPIGEEILDFVKYNEREVLFQTEKEFNLFTLPAGASITFTINYFK